MSSRQIAVEVLQTFIDIFETKLKKWVKAKKPEADTTSRDALWAEVKANHEISEIIFRNLRPQFDYFRKQISKSATKNSTSPVSVNYFYFCDCLEFINRPLPIDDDLLPYDERWNTWCEAFIKKHFLKHPDYQKFIEISISQKKLSDVSKGANSDFHRSAEIEINALIKDKIFIAESKQGQLTDRVVLRINVNENNDVSGNFEVLFQEPDLNYREETVVLPITGKLRYGFVLNLEFKNQKPGTRHTGTFFGIVSAERHRIEGVYSVYYPDRPKIRETWVADIVLNECLDEATANTFIDDWRGKHTDGEYARKFLLEWQEKNAIQKELNYFINKWREQGTYEKEIREFIKKCHDSHLAEV